MLKTVNFAVFKCMDCSNTIKVQPSQVIEKVECDCKADTLGGVINPYAKPIEKKKKPAKKAMDK